MARPEKAAKVAELKEEFSTSAAAVLTEYRGLTVKDLRNLRRSLGEDASYAVAKNTLAAIAAKEAGIEGLDESLTGPTAIAFVKGDIAAAAKGLRDFAKANPSLTIKGGVLEGKVLDSQAVLKLADLESREVLLAKMAGALQANLAKAAYMLAAPLSQGARAFGALQSAAEANPSLIGGAGSAPAAEVKDETPAADAATEAAPAAE
jgi:large subunit ribosomal protein L10